MSILRQGRLAARASLAGLLIGLLAIVLFFAWARGDSGRVAADVPHAGLDFSIAVDTNGDTTNDCNSSGTPTATCTVDAGARFTVKIYLNSRGGVSYQSFDFNLSYTGVVSKDNPLILGVWTDCAIPASFVVPGVRVTAGCSTGVGAPPSTYEGRMATNDFNCVASGTINLVHGESDTNIAQHAEGEGTSEALTIACGGGPPPASPTPTQPVEPTATPTTGPPTSTPTIGPSPTPTSTRPPTATPTITSTPQPTATRTATPLPTATPERLRGDGDGNGVVDSADALAVLQLEAGIRRTLRNPEKADANGDGRVNAIDALFILWIEAGLLD